MNSIAQNLANFEIELQKVCQKFGRNRNEITLIAVTKNHSADEARELLTAGVTAIGENRIQEAAAKFPELPTCERHLIGHLQSNKIREAVELFDCIHSVDSLKIAKKLSAAATKKMPIFLQTNLAAEPQKFGFLENEISEALAEIRELPNLEVVGLMAMGVARDEEKTREVFVRGRELTDKFGLQKFSAGMSNDWKIAVECGATHLRIGSLLFA